MSATIEALRAAVRNSYQSIESAQRPEVWIALRPQAEVDAEVDEIAARLAAGANLPLAGLIGAVKDNIDVAGLATTAAAPSFSYLPSADAPAVARLRDAGALFIGKTNLDQFATGLVGTRSPYGAVRNAWDPDRISGGSSSGSAVAVALGQVDFALGTDTAGSGRVPAALNGIVGVKPTRGLVSTTGVVPASRRLDCVTVFARTLALGRQLAELMAGPDASDPLSRTWQPPRKGTGRIGVPSAKQLGPLAPGWAEAFAAAAQRFDGAGVQVVEVDIEPLLEAALMLYGSAYVAERFSAVGHHIEQHRELIGSTLDSTVSGIILAGADHRAGAVFDALERLDRLALTLRGVFSTVDALLTPTTTSHPTLAEVAADPVGTNSRMGRFTNFANLLDCAGLAVPAGFVDGLPFGVMLTGPAFSDRRLARLAEVLLNPQVELLVVGAHLRGQPLNRQLVTAGGSLVGEVRTAADYRLFALDTQPPKPGLVRVGSEGASIAGELWRMPAAGLGNFLTALPAPMVLGKVRLTDGRQVTGFLVEPAAVEGARDITRYGGWRAFLADS